jgi:dTMP kinase
MGSFIAIDGLDASGKQTQTEKLCEHFKNTGIAYRHLSFPTYDEKYSALVKLYLSGKFGEKPTDVNAYAASTFFAVDRYASYMADWKKDFDDGKIIISDRYTTANAVHQLSKLPREAWDDYLSWLWKFEFQLLGLPQPTTVIFLQVSPETSMKTAKKRADAEGGKVDIHEASPEYIQKCFDAAQFAASTLGWHIIKCDDENGFRSREDIFSDILSIVEKSEFK